MFAAIDNWLFLILLAAAALFRLLTKVASAAKTSEPPEQSSSPPARQGQQPQESGSSDEDQIRKFLEALGQPRSGNVPPPVRPRTDVPPRPVAPVRPPPSMVPLTDLRKLRPASGKEAERGEQGGEPGSMRKRFQPKSPRPVQPRDVPAYEVDVPSVAPEVPRTPTPTRPVIAEPQVAGGSAAADAIQLLRNPQSLRQAIILREIFGVPRSLQPLEDLPGTA
jgi:hypothetical protein